MEHLQGEHCRETPFGEKKQKEAATGLNGSCGGKGFSRPGLSLTLKQGGVSSVSRDLPRPALIAASLVSKIIRPFRKARAASRYVPATESLLWSISIFILCVADAVFTLVHTEHGAAEINPLMQYLLALGTPVFLLVKIMVSALSLIMLAVLLPKVRAARPCFCAVCGIYAVVVSYHIGGFIL